MAATNTFSKQVMWHDDGDIVLVCGGSAAFRVHLDVLAAQSNIFKYMAQIPQPRQVCYETYQDCPVIRLHDASEDLQRFIKAIYELQTSLGTPTCTCTDFGTASSLLRLGTKYDAPLVRQRAIDVFASVYPCTSDAWSRRDTIRQFPPFSRELCATLALALTNDVQSLIPSILYTAAKLPPPEAISELSELSEIHSNTLQTSVSVAPEIAQDMYRRYMMGRQALHRAEVAAMMSYLSPSFTQPKCVRSGLPNLSMSPNANAKSEDRAASEGCCAANPFKVRGRQSGLCATCSELIEKSIQEGAEELWRRVPEMFGYASWETLKERDKLGDF